MSSRALFLVLAVLAAACSDRAAEPAPAALPAAQAAPAPAPAPAPVATPDATARLRVEGTGWRKGAAVFEWRGITAFRLLEQIAHGREAEAVAYLDWARAQQLTVVRVLVMAAHLFELAPADGIKALPRLLTLAAERNLAVEIVALADTADIPVDPAQHVKAVGAIAAAHPNAVVEIANEPWHQTQDARLHDPAFVRSLADLVPGVAVALGSGEGADAYTAGGGYATWHAPRSHDPEGWGHVIELADGAAILGRLQKPLVSDEPIGAAEEASPGRRDDTPARFAAAAALTRLAGLGATFHYEGGLEAKVPTGKPLECFQAWSAALEALKGLPPGGRFVGAAGLAAIGSAKAARAAYGRVFEREVWVVLVDPTDAVFEWKAPWKESGRIVLPGTVIVGARSDAPAPTSRTFP